MDIDRYIARNDATWRRLEELTLRGRTNLSKLTPEEIEELVQLYQRTSAHLSYARTYLRQPALVARLTQLVASANGLIYGRKARPGRAIGDFLRYTYPGAVYTARKQILAAGIVFFLPALILCIWLVRDPAALDRTAPPKIRAQYEQQELGPYYSDSPSGVFFAEVTTNNIRVSFLAFALGAVSGGIGALYILFQNGAILGVVSGWMIADGEGWRFFGYIIPHGALELSAIVIAGGAGLRIGFSALAPGDRTRADAFREEGLRSVSIVMGLMTMFVAAGLIEGFITGSRLPVALRVIVGVVLWVAYVTYLVAQGRAAASLGLTGMFGENRTRLAEVRARRHRLDAFTTDRDDVPVAVPGHLG